MNNTTNYNNVVFDIEPNSDVLPSTVHLIFQVLIFCAGLFVQIKTISACKEDQGKTWKIHVTHSIVLTIFYGYTIPFHAITYSVPFLSKYTGSWICYTASFISLYCFQSIMANSLLIVVEKYFFIVHAIKCIKFGETRVQKYFFWINLLHPLLLTIVAMFTTNVEQRSALKSCFGKTTEDLQEYNISSPRSFEIPGCPSNNPKKHSLAVFYVLHFVCASRWIINVIFATNLIEGFCYYKIFKKMKR